MGHDDNEILRIWVAFRVAQAFQLEVPKTASGSGTSRSEGTLLSVEEFVDAHLADLAGYAAALTGSPERVPTW